MDESKIFKYRGKTIDELKALKLEEFMTLLPSRERRKMLRGFTEAEQKFLKKVRNNERNIKTHCRDMIVLPEFVGMKFSVHNGKGFEQVAIVDEMVGMRFGELAPTRKIGVAHSGGGAKKTDVRK